MKKIGIALLISVALLSTVFISLRLTGKIDFFEIPTSANEPNIKTGTRFFATTLLQPERLDFICFTAKARGSEQKDIYVFRLCAVAGDKVEIRDGLLLVNGQRIDQGIKLSKEYLVPKRYLPVIKKADGQAYDNIWDKAADTMHVFTTDAVISGNHIPAMPVIYAKDYTDDFIQQQWGKSWNMDQFGPVVVPPKSYFVLGDNRHNAMDSRYRGFIPQQDYRSTVLKKAAN